MLQDAGLAKAHPLRLSLYRRCCKPACPTEIEISDPVTEPGDRLDAGKQRGSFGSPRKGGVSRECLQVTSERLSRGSCGWKEATDTSLGLQGGRGQYRVASKLSLWKVRVAARSVFALH